MASIRTQRAWFAGAIALFISGMSAVSGGCASTSAISARGFESPTFGYVVAFEQPAQQAFLPGDWRLDNYSVNPADHTYAEKRSGEYMGKREMDEDGDGEISVWESNNEPIYDLKFVNSRDDGVIWIKAHPMRSVDRERELTVVIDNYIDSLAGRGLYSQGSVFSTSRAKTREFTTFVKEKRERTVDGHAAVEAIVELAEVEKLKVDPNHRNVTIKVVFTRFGYAEEVSRTANTYGWKTFTQGSKVFASKRGLLAIGYANAAGRFDRSVGDFDALIERVRFPKSTPGPKPSGQGASSAPAPASASPPAAAASSTPSP